MPQAMNYKANSVIYFRGDASKKIYILQSGRVVLKTEDIETKQERQEAVGTGEFFGVKSALGKYARDEDAIVLSDTNVVTFTVQEFEQLVGTNTRVGMKMLKVFSNQLRRIQGKVRSLLALDEQKNPEDGLFYNAEFYLKKKKYQEAIHILRRYIATYPSGKYLANAQKYLKLAQEYFQRYGSNNGPAIIADDTGRGAPAKRPPAAGAGGGGSAPSKSPEEKAFYDAVSLGANGKFQEAIAQLQKMVEADAESDMGRKANFEIGRNLFGLKQYENCIKHFGSLVKQYGDYPELADSLFFVGQCYEKLNDKAKALNVFERILSMEGLEEDTKRKVKAASKAVGGK